MRVRALACGNQAEKKRKAKRLKRESWNCGKTEARARMHDQVLSSQSSKSSKSASSRVLPGVAVEVESADEKRERRWKHEKANRPKPLPVPLTFN